MQRIFTTLFLTLSLTTYGQRGMWKPFKLCVIKPDTAFIDQSLFSDRDSIESGNLKSYYASLKQMEFLLNFIAFARTKLRARFLRASVHRWALCQHWTKCIITGEPNALFYMVLPSHSDGLNYKGENQLIDQITCTVTRRMDTQCVSAGYLPR